LSAYGECPYRFYLERVLDLGDRGRHFNRMADEMATAPGPGPAGREERTARGAAVHSLLEWSQANDWQEPSEETARRHAVAAGLDPRADGALDDLLAPVRAWLGSALLRDRVRGGGAVRAEVPILLGIEGAVLRGSIDLLVERPGAAPLVVDYKTDRLNGSSPTDHASRYAIQRDIYALAVAEARQAEEVEVAYVFLEQSGEPVATSFDTAKLDAARGRLADTVKRIRDGEFTPASLENRDRALCGDCPALGLMCSGPR
ncbi:MAG TPA: PD-(D/E)XK nuclease family protein, partial [Solirubrobacterales bacterium]|nr:PD-(D/E)XK nuclease family protein [Solirubrobacterales bacterium]